MTPLEDAVGKDDTGVVTPGSSAGDAGQVRLRPALAGLPSYRPGKVAPEVPSGGHLFKVSSNENPYPPLPGVLEAAVAAAGMMNRYPDLFASELTATLARHFDVPADHIATGTGSVGMLQQVVQSTAAAGDEVVYAWRSFEAYPIVVGISGATSVRVPLTTGGRHDLSAMAEAITDRTRLVIVCSPNNPTGPTVGRDELDVFMSRVPDDVLVVIDEAYVEFVRDSDAASGLDLYRRHPNVCVLRTFSKAYGLAGLRVGFGVAHDAVASALRATAVPFGVSTVAQRAAVESLSSEAELFARVDALVAERVRVSEVLRSQGWDIARSEANFVWLDLGEKTSEFARECEKSGLIVRSFADEGCRVTIAEREANETLIDVAARWSSAAG